MRDSPPGSKLRPAQVMTVALADPVVRKKASSMSLAYPGD